MKMKNALCDNCLKMAVLFASLVLCVQIAHSANEEWSGSNLTIHGSTDPVATYVKYMNGETLEAGVIKLGTELGSASLVAVDSTITLTGNFYLGREESPGFSKLSSSLYLTNTVLTCGSEKDFIMGYDIAGSGPVSADIGPGSVLTCRKVYRYANPAPTLRFTGGRMVLAGGTASYEYVFAMEGHTWSGNWPNNGVEVRGENAPIDIEVPAVGRRLAGGWAARKVSLSGNGGFVKRGSGTLQWGWYTYGSNDGYIDCYVSYTGDTVIKEGGIKITTPSAAAKNQRTYKTASKSALKIEEGAWFDFAGNPVTFLGVSGAGMITNSSATATTLTLGSSGGSGEFSPAIVGGAFDIEKLGEGTLTIGTSHIDGSLLVSNGTVKVASGTSFRCEDVVVLPSATLDLRGAHLTCGRLSIPRGAVILKDEDTAIDTTFEVADDDEWMAGRFAYGGAARKTGSGTLTLFGESAKGTGSVAIDQGTVVCKPAPSFEGRYFRIQYYGDAAKDVTWEGGVQFSEFSLYGTTGERINKGKYSYTRIPAAETQQYGALCGIDDATQLSECEVNIWMPNHNGYFSESTGSSPKYIFDGDTTTYQWNTYYWDASNVLVFRVPDGSSAVAGFTFTTSIYPTRRPTQWKLVGSPDGVNWTTLADNATNTADAATWTYLTNSTPDTAETEYRLMTLDKLPVVVDFAPFGNAEVSVASGATLDFESAEMLISRLKAGSSVGGTITRFTPAANGVLDLDLPGGDVSSFIGASGAELLTVNELGASGRENLSTWRVSVNGVVDERLALRWKNGKLTLVWKPGAILIVF